jgi:hypothetical protein
VKLPAVPFVTVTSPTTKFVTGSLKVNVYVILVPLVGVVVGLAVTFTVGFVVSILLIVYVLAVLTFPAASLTFTVTV